ncbi:hypothetical protein V6N13_093372 [Hibiscus sabdariffa]
MMALILDGVLCRLADLGSWILVGVSSCNSAMSMLVESSKGAVCYAEVDYSTFLFDVAEASGISTVGRFHFVGGEL